MIGRDDRARKRRRGNGARRWIRSSFVAWIAVAALVLQLGSAPAHRAMASSSEADAVAALGALSALLGPNVALCLHEDGSAPGAPSHDSHDCCVDCALCQSIGHTAALVPPATAVPVVFAALAERLGVPDAPAIAEPRLVAAAQPRAPPSFA
jgi:hypothetical protein